MQQVTFELTAQDLVAARKLHYRTYIKSKRAMRGYILGTAIILCLTLATIPIWGLATGLTITAMGLLYWCALLGAILLVGYWRVPSQSRRLFAQHKALVDRTTADWDSNGIAFTSAKGSTRLAWGDFTGLMEDDHSLLLLQNELLFNLIPKRVLSIEQIADIRTSAGNAG